MTVLVTPSALRDRKVREFEMLIDGRPSKGAEGRTLERIAPGHGIAVSRYQAADGRDAERAIAAARKAFDDGPWPRMTAAERSRILLTVAAMIDARADELAYLDAMEAGKPITQVKGEIAGAADIWRYAAALARDLHGESYNTLGDGTLGVVLREAVGVVSIITPWNFPFLIVSQKLPFALAAGCTTVVKPSELTSGSTLLLGEIMSEAGVPAGVVNILVGTGPEVGSVLTSHPAVDMVSFTGSTGVGRLTMSNAAKTLKKVSLELGGKNPQIVFPDADWTPLSMRRCSAPISTPANAAMPARASSSMRASPKPQWRASDGSLPTSRSAIRWTRRRRSAPSSRPQHLSKIAAYVDAAAGGGATIAHGGTPLDLGMGQYMAPTILSGVTPDMAVAREEVFGPVLSVLTFRSAGRGDRHCQRGRLRSVGGRLEPRLRHLP